MSRHRQLPGEDGHLDLVPLIDCVFLVLLFFMLCGHLSDDLRPEQISVPPARTAGDVRQAPQRLVISIRAGEPPALRLGDGAWTTLAGTGCWTAVRRSLDAVWDRAGSRISGGIRVADAVLELRVDGDVPYRVVQDLESVCSDAVDPSDLRPRGCPPPRPFTAIDFTARPAG
jgi:hypothetical protein